MPIQSHELKDVESFAQNVSRAIVPRRTLRGPAVHSSRGDACSVAEGRDPSAFGGGPSWATLIYCLLTARQAEMRHTSISHHLPASLLRPRTSTPSHESLKTRLSDLGTSEVFG